MIERVGERIHDRDLYLARIARLEDWPDRIDEPNAHFVLFLAVDGTRVDEDAVRDFAVKTLAQGAAYVCVWGPGCERVHDLFDEVVGTDLGGPDEAWLMTTWHADETLESALWYAVFAACPDDRFIETCGSVLAVVVDDPAWGERVRDAFADPRRLQQDVAL